MRQRDCCEFRKDARILVLSQRRYNQQFYMPPTYEFEDVISEIDGVDLLAPAFKCGSRLSKLWYRGSNYAKSRLALCPDPGIEDVEIEREYDLFFCVFNLGYEVPALKRLKRLRRRCKRMACMFMEMFTSQVHRDERSLRMLDELEADYIFVHQRSSLPALQQVLKTPCVFMPVGVDCLTFVPYPVFPARTIDCFSMGRRSEATHQGLLELSRDKDFFYVYDTFAKFPLASWREHRMLTASMMARTRYFVAYKPALRTDVFVGSDECLAGRFFEGTAGGAVVIGVPPDCKEYYENFNWPDATIEIPYECRNIGDILVELDEQPERLARVRRTNMIQCLLRHDWMYRWRSILERVGLEPPGDATRRESRLHEVVERLQSAAPDSLHAAGNANEFRLS